MKTTIACVESQGHHPYRNQKLYNRRGGALQLGSGASTISMFGVTVDLTWKHSESRRSGPSKLASVSSVVGFRNWVIASSAGRVPFSSSRLVNTHVCNRWSLSKVDRVFQSSQRTFVLVWCSLYSSAEIVSIRVH